MFLREVNGLKRFLAFCLVLLLPACPVAAADLSFTPSTYNEWGEPVTGASGYQPTRTIDGSSLGVGSWSAPADLAVSPDGETLFVLDAGNNRVTMCGADFQQGRSLDAFISEEGETQLNGATGLFFDGTSLYIADKGNARVLRSDTAGRVTGVFEKPASPLFPQEKQFLPTRVAADTNGVVYVICEGIDQGAVMFSPEGSFLGYIGSNKVQTTIAVLFNSLIKKLVSQEAQENMAKYTPVEFNNLTIDRDNFLYTCTDVQDVKEKIKKLNASGVNILSAKVDSSFQKGFGDIHPPYVDGTTAHSRFVDIAVDETGCFYGLDFTNMRVFAYDESANLLFTFGGPGTQAGLFLNPVAVEVMGGRVLVLDTNTCQITCFEKTEFGALVGKAMGLYQQGLYSESVQPWNDVLKYNTNYTMAYIGLGKAHLELGNVTEALQNFETAHYEAGYNEAYRILRVDKMRANFPVYFVLVLLVLFFIYGRQIPPVRRLFSRAGAAVRRLAVQICRRLRPKKRVGGKPYG